MNRHPAPMVRNPTFDISPVDASHHCLAALPDADRVEPRDGFADACGGACRLRAISRNGVIEVARLDLLRLANASMMAIHEWNAA